jgi:glycosyltransferase involved in cell wall biosynthesis
MSNAPALRDAATAVVPCFNAGERLEHVLVQLSAFADHVVLVDDGSTDGAAERVAHLASRYVRIPENHGKGYALLEGFRAALERPACTCLITLDADGQHAPADMAGLYARFVETGAGLVIGARSFARKDIPWPSWIGNRLTAAIVGVLMGTRLPDTQSGFRLHSRSFAEHIVARLTGGRYETEMEIIVRAIRDGFPVESVPIQTIYETGNPSSHFQRGRDSIRIYARLVKAVWR